MLQPITVLTLPLPLRLGTVNCYLIQTGSGHVLIDTGGSNARKILVGGLQSAGCTSASLALTILTHGDFDHIGNAAFLRSAYGARVAMHPDDSGMAEHGDMFANRKPPNPILKTLIPLFTGFGDDERFSPDILLWDECALDTVGLDATVLTLPGHSKGSVGILTPQGELFCGDLFTNTNGPKLNSLMDDPAAARASVARLQRLGVTMVYPGHGRPFAMEDLATAPVRAG